MQTYQIFQPRNADQATPAAQVNGAVTASVTQINLPTSFGGGQSDCSAIFNVQGTDPIAWCYGARAGLTLGNGVFMLPNTSRTFVIPSGVTQISVISSGTASTLRIVIGDGV